MDCSLHQRKWQLAVQVQASAADLIWSRCSHSRPECRQHCLALVQKMPCCNRKRGRWTRWQKHPEPFAISSLSVTQSVFERLSTDALFLQDGGYQQWEWRCSTQAAKAVHAREWVWQAAGGKSSGLCPEGALQQSDRGYEPSVPWSAVCRLIAVAYRQPGQPQSSRVLSSSSDQCYLQQLLLLSEHSGSYPIERLHNVLLLHPDSTIWQQRS